MPTALDLALGLAVYDSLYLAMAIAARTELVTADSEIVKLVRNSPFQGQVILLKSKASSDFI